MRLGEARPLWLCREAAVCGLLACLFLTGSRGGPAQAANPPAPSPSTVESATLEEAPGALGKTVATGSLAVLTAAKGKEVLLFDSGTSELSAYLESGATWGKPLRLHGGDGGAAVPPVFRVAASDDQIAFASPRGVTVFDRETGDLVAEAKSLHHAAGIAVTPDGWAVSLTHLPFPEIEKLDREVFGGPAPRFVVVNEKLEIWRQGITAPSGQTANQTAARSLRLAAGPGRLFAAEIANYKLYEFDRNFKAHGIFVDPTLKQEEGSAAPGKAEQEALLAEARQRMARGGTDATRPPARPGTSVERSEFFAYKTVLWDMAWDPSSHLLVLLLASGVAGDDGALDLVDPATGEVRRLLLRFPEGTARQELVQLALGYRYIWLRNYDGHSPTFRLDRAALDRARKVGVLQAE